MYWFHLHEIAKVVKSQRRMWLPRLWKIKVKVFQSCPTLRDPMDYTVPGILQTRILDWLPFPFSRGSSQSRDQTQISRIACGFFTSWATREALTRVCGGEIWSCYKKGICLIHARWINSRDQLYSTVLIGSNTVM